MKYTYMLSLLTLLASCQDDGFDQQPTDAGAEDSALAICECETPTAAAVTYDNQASSLQSSNVQEAVDELAMRETLDITDIADRITMVETSRSSAAGELLVATAECPAGSIIIGGGCNHGFPTLLLQGAGIRNGRYQCSWRSTDGFNETGTAQATCLATE